VNSKKELPKPKKSEQPHKSPQQESMTRHRSAKLSAAQVLVASTRSGRLSLGAAERNQADMPNAEVDVRKPTSGQYREKVGQSQKYPLRLNGTIAEGGAC
jgi:hypothetical protein